VIVLGCALWLTGDACGTHGPLPDFDFGFVACSDRDLEENHRLRVAGPVFERQQAESNAVFRAVRPFFSSVDEPSRERQLLEFLWPAGMFKRLGDETYWRFLTAYGHDFDNRTSDSRYRAIILPFVYAGRDANDEKYFALFPLAGKVNECLGRDKIVFVLFPLYAFSSINDVQTRDILWPLISHTRGEGISRFRAFPFYGRSFHEKRWTKQFVMWPVWTSVRYHYPGSEGQGFLLFPFCGHVKVDDKDAWTVLPPLFKWSMSGEDRKLNCPWPFIQYRAGEVDKLYVWPLWGRKRQQRQRSWFFLWPISLAQRIEGKEAVLNRFFLLPFVFHETRTATEQHEHTSEGPDAASEENAVTERYLKLWPILSYRREADVSRLRFLGLWPGKHMASVERNLSPFWTLYSHVRAGASHEHELFWGLFRHRYSDKGTRRTSLFPLFSCDRSAASGGSRGWSFLMGLAGYRRQAQRKEYRLLYFLRFHRADAETSPRQSAE